MSTTSQNSASSRISALLDDNSFVEIGGSVTGQKYRFQFAEQRNTCRWSINRIWYY